MTDCFQIFKCLDQLPAPSNRSPLEAFADLKIAGGDLLEGAGSRR